MTVRTFDLCMPYAYSLKANDRSDARRKRGEIGRRSREQVTAWLVNLQEKDAEERETLSLILI